MPVRSQAQWAWLAIHRPDLLRKWQHEAPVSRSELPKHARKTKARGR